MAKRLFVVVAVLGLFVVALAGQSNPQLQGVWRVVEVTINNPSPAPGLLPKGTHTNVQPAMLIITGKHYSTITDTAAKPRPATGFKVAGKPTAEEMQTQWGPFQANSGTYEVSGSTLTFRPIVAKNPALQAKGMLRYTFKSDGKNLWMTLVETTATKVANPATVKYSRIE